MFERANFAKDQGCEVLDGPRGVAIPDQCYLIARLELISKKPFGLRMGLSRSCFVPGDLTEWPTMLSRSTAGSAPRLNENLLMLAAENNFEIGFRVRLPEARWSLRGFAQQCETMSGPALVVRSPSFIDPAQQGLPMLWYAPSVIRAAAMSGNSLPSMQVHCASCPRIGCGPASFLEPGRGGFYVGVGSGSVQGIHLSTARSVHCF